MAHPIAGETVHTGLSIAASALIIALILAYAAFVIGAFVGILRSRFSGGMKFVWCVFVLIAPFLGSLLWFLIGSGYAARQPSPSTR
jgi:hypothetical protein